MVPGVEDVLHLRNLACEHSSGPPVTNEITSKMTFMYRVDQSQVLEFPTGQTTNCIVIFFYRFICFVFVFEVILANVCMKTNCYLYFCISTIFQQFSVNPSLPCVVLCLHHLVDINHSLENHAGG